eukprot:CAMPEP_0182590692 /NCGR_PEP_ID=MMETSP1324-20130603/72162_1 /TAXON_ID=236786 /ORGANISM="Florenciella sp., Strain RCC1587" /LENGTH=54 /DNA_ID=CAMNT_0024807923 /DNA_START=80 /DNA_END=241 /DNA_ORIENTATION=+
MLVNLAGSPPLSMYDLIVSTSSALGCIIASGRRNFSSAADSGFSKAGGGWSRAS